MIEKLIIKNNSKGDKRLVAEIFIKNKNKPLVRRFGSATGFTFYDGADETTRENYLKRHSKLNENWNDITTAGALSRWVLWELQNNQSIEKLLNRKFKIPIVKVNIKKNSV